MSEPRTFLDGSVVLHHGDCMEVMRGMADNSVDSVCTDPPYHLRSIVKRFGGANAAPAKNGTDGAFKRASGGFMGKQWDGGDIAFQTKLWAEVLRVLKPGGHAIIFGGTRTAHRMVCAIEDAGFDIRDEIEFDHATELEYRAFEDSLSEEQLKQFGKLFRERGDGRISWVYGSGFNKKGYIFKDDNGRPIGPWGGALKPAHEPICLARKYLSEPTVALNIARWGTGAINVWACKIAAPNGKIPGGRGASNGSVGWQPSVNYDESSGRWPANLIHDNSEEVLACFPETGVASASPRGLQHSGRHGGLADLGENIKDDTNSVRGHDDNGGSSARFFASFPKDDVQRIFYTSKAGQDDRLGSSHPTVKPLDLIQYLVRLVTPKNCVCLDLFAGTGTTGEACFREGFRSILIEREAEYIKDIERRMSLVMEGPDTRAYASMKARNRPRDDGPLFNDPQPYQSGRTIWPVGMNKREEEKRGALDEAAE